MKNLVAVLAFLFCVIASSAFALSRPADWSQNDWEKFIEEGVQIGLGEALGKAGSAVPLVDVYSALSAFGSSTNTGLRIWLNRKMAETENVELINRYQAFASCLDGDCSRLRQLESQGGGSQTFANPTYNGYRVDRCYNFAQQCDKPAADAFCKLQGFSQSTDLKWEYTAPTYTLGDGKVCGDASACGGFSMITCAK